MSFPEDGSTGTDGIARVEKVVRSLPCKSP
jgi:hypothetical protein